MTPPGECLSFSALGLCGGQAVLTPRSSPPCKPEDTEVYTFNLLFCLQFCNVRRTLTLNSEHSSQLSREYLTKTFLMQIEHFFHFSFCLKPHFIFQWRRKFHLAVGCTWTCCIFISGIKGKELMGTCSRLQRYCWVLAPLHVTQSSGAQIQTRSGVPR